MHVLVKLKNNWVIDDVDRAGTLEIAESKLRYSW